MPLETMTTRFSIAVCFVLACFAGNSFTSTAAAKDAWKVVVKNAGVEGMHMTTFHTDKVAFFDRTHVGATGMKLANGRCRDNANDQVLKHDCYAHSVQYDSITNAVRPLFINTDTFCSSGAFWPDGTLQQTGGDHEGATVIRTLGGGAQDDWKEKTNYLVKRRWYAANQILPDGKIIVIGGTKQPSYEFIPKSARGATPLGILSKAYDSTGENNLYPFVHLLPDGNLFIFANVYSQIFNYKTNKVVKDLPKLGSDPRVYPYSGTSVLLPLLGSDNYKTAEVVIFGGGTLGAYAQAKKRVYLPALNTCARIVVTAATPKWSIEKMPGRRIMVDGMLLPTGEVLLVNGMQDGLSGWNTNRNPALSPFLYNPTQHQFSVQTATNIVRGYHSSANVQSDGTVLIAGGNDQSKYTYSGVRFPTELRLEKYYPYYLNAAYDVTRPTIVGVTGSVQYNADFVVTFKIATPPSDVKVSVYAPSFTTHANSMNQRLVVLKEAGGITGAGGGAWKVTVTAPPNGNITPPGYYMLTVLNAGAKTAIPSKAKWIHIG